VVGHATAPRPGSKLGELDGVEPATWPLAQRPATDTAHECLVFLTAGTAVGDAVEVRVLTAAGLVAMVGSGEPRTYDHMPSKMLTARKRARRRVAYDESSKAATP
jgi:hypothetical protein